MNTSVMQFESYTILKINYKVFSEDDLEKEIKKFDDRFKDHQASASNDQDVKITNKIGIGLDDDQSQGLVMLTISIFDKKYFRAIDLKIAGEYKFNDEDKAQKESEKLYLLKVNGVAILYPYARSIISTITSLNSPNALLLPTIKTALVNEKG